MIQHSNLKELELVFLSTLSTISKDGLKLSEIFEFQYDSLDSLKLFHPSSWLLNSYVVVAPLLSVVLVMV